MHILCKRSLFSSLEIKLNLNHKNGGWERNEFERCDSSPAKNQREAKKGKIRKVLIFNLSPTSATFPTNPNVTQMSSDIYFRFHLVYSLRNSISLSFLFNYIVNQSVFFNLTKVYFLKIYIFYKNRIAALNMFVFLIAIHK